MPSSQIRSSNPERRIERALRILAERGPRGLLRAIKSWTKRQISGVRLLVFAIESRDTANLLVTENLSLDQELQVKRVLPLDDADIDGLTEIDPWKIPASVTRAWLQDGWRCYVSKDGCEVLASQWAILSEEFYETFLQRRFVLSQDEAYYHRSYCAAKHRGKGILPSLLMQVVASLRRDNGKVKHLTLMRASNATMHRSLTRKGWRVVGRAGFLEACGIRLHYLLGRKAFRETRPRIFVRPSSIGRLPGSWPFPERTIGSRRKRISPH